LEELHQNFLGEVKKLNNDYGDDDDNDVNNNKNICQDNGHYASIYRITSANHLAATVHLPDLEYILTSLETLLCRLDFAAVSPAFTYIYIF